MPGSARAGASDHRFKEDVQTRHFDLTPLYRTTVGFDRLGSLLDTLGSHDNDAESYPPYNIELVDENAYRISMAVAGFGANDLNIEAEENTLTIHGEKQTEKEESTFLHRGIAARSFERRFQLADHVLVKGARLENGLLHVDLVRELPEAMKPRTIPISTNDAETKGEQPRIIDSKAA
jgi:molecular chaperone IbpA